MGITGGVGAQAHRVHGLAALNSRDRDQVVCRGGTSAPRQVRGRLREGTGGI